MSSDVAPADRTPVTLAIARHIRPGQEAAFEAWVKDISAAARTFDGHLAADLIRPPGPGAGEYVLIFRFASEAHYRHWEAAPERAALLERVAPLIEGEVRHDLQTGLEYWFTPTLPGGPPRIRQAALTVLALYPVNLLVNLLIDPYLRGWLPLAPLVLFNTVLGVLALTYLLMPRVTRLFAPWLHARGG